MEREDVNELILDEVDEIEDEGVRRFVEDILRFERSHINQKQPHFMADYNKHLNERIDSWTQKPQKD